MEPKGDLNMTQEEAIKFAEHAVNMTNIPEVKEFYRMFAAALRPVSREQVEKVWRAHWNESTHLGGFVYCSRCGYNALEANNYTFCPKCGSPFTDEAVEIVVERLEALKDGSTPD